jgi:hypothetical protein
MENFSYHVPVFVVNSGVATSGHSADLSGGQVGVFDRATWSVATSAGNGIEMFFAQGNIGGKDWYGFPTTATSHKSPFFYAKDVENMYLSLPQRKQNEEWIVGYNGADSSKGIRYFKGAEPVKVKFLFTGGPTYRYFGGPKEYVVSYSPEEDCVTPCSGDCTDTEVDPLFHVKKHIEKINNHVELKKFGVHVGLVSNTYAATATNMEKFQLKVCDNGDGVALNAVKAQYPTIANDITRVSRTGSVSTYEVCVVSTAGNDTPAAFQQSGSVLLAVCGTCPAGSTLTAAKDVYLIRRPLAGTENLTSDAAKDTYADTVGTAYSVATDADKTFVGVDGGVAIVKIKVASGTAVTALVADVVELSHTEAASCTFAAPASIAWSAAGTGIRSKRTMKIKQLQRPNCDANGDRLADLQSILAGVKGIDIGTLTLIEGDACHDDYTVEQFSVDCLSEEACQTNEVTFTYDDLPTIDNQAWEVVPGTPAAAPFTTKVGMRITADYKDIRFGNDSFDMADYYETMPLKMEVSIFREWASNCDASLFPSVVQTKYGAIERQSGEWVVREVICKTDAYQKHINQYSDSPRMREAFDMNLLNMVDRKAFYNLYYVTFYASYGKLWRKPSVQEKFTAVFAFKEDDPAQESFKTNVLDVLTAKSGVKLHVNP